MAFSGDKAMPNCQQCECGECDIIDADNFERESLGGDYTVQLGTAAIEGAATEKVLRLSNARALVLRDDLHPDGDDGASRVKALILPGSNARGRLIALYTDDGNYCGLEIDENAGCPILRLFYREAGTETYSDWFRPLPTMPELGYLAHLCVEVGVAGSGESTPSDILYPASSSGTTGWTNPDNILAEDDTDAIFSFAGAETSDALIATQFDFSSIPSDATITGISVGVRCRTPPLTGLTPAVLSSLRIGWGGVPQGTDQGNNQPVPPPLDGYNVLGTGVDELFDTTPTVANLNDGFFILAEFTSTDTIDVGVDVIYVTIYYTTAADVTGRLSAHVGTGTAWPDKVYLEMEIPADMAGDQVGMEVPEGEVTFDDFDWKYHKSDLHSVCPLCQPPCVFFSDAAPEIGCHWLSGLLSRHVNPQPEHGTKISVTALPDTATDPITVFVDFDGVDRVEVTVESDGTDATLTIYRDGVEEVQEDVPGYDGSTAIDIEVCWFDGSVIATAGGIVAQTTYTSIGGYQFGLVDTAVTFTNFSAQSLAPECPQCGGSTEAECGCCEDGEASSLVAVSAEGFTGTFPDEWNGTLLAELIPSPGCSGAIAAFCDSLHEGDSMCVWHWPSPGIATPSVNVFLVRHLPNEWWLYAEYNGVGNPIIASCANEQAYYRVLWKQQATRPDCRNIDATLDFICDSTGNPFCPDNFSQPLTVRVRSV